MCCTLIRTASSQGSADELSLVQAGADRAHQRNEVAGAFQVGGRLRARRRPSIAAAMPAH